MPLSDATSAVLYARAYPANAVVFHKSKMDLILQTDASYLSRSNSRSVAGGIGYFGDASNPIKENGMVYAMSSIIDVIVAQLERPSTGPPFSTRNKVFIFGI